MNFAKKDIIPGGTKRNFEYLNDFLNFKTKIPMFEKLIYHATPEEALRIGQDLNSRKVLGMHWGTVLLSLGDPFEPPIRFKKAAKEYGFAENDAIIFKIGESRSLKDLLK